MRMICWESGATLHEEETLIEGVNLVDDLGTIYIKLKGE